MSVEPLSLVFTGHMVDLPGRSPPRHETSALPPSIGGEAPRRERSMAVAAEAPSLLSSLIFDSDGARLSPTHAVKKGKRYRYYVSTALIARSRSEHPRGRRIPAGDIEGLVLDRLRALFASAAEVSDAVAPLGLDAATQTSTSVGLMNTPRS